MINKPFISSEKVIDITFSAFILFMIYFYFIRALKTTLDYILANLAYYNFNNNIVYKK